MLILQPTSYEKRWNDYAFVTVDRDQEYAKWHFSYEEGLFSDLFQAVIITHSRSSHAASQHSILLAVHHAQL